MVNGLQADTPWWPYVKELDDPEPDALPLVFTHKNEWQHDYYHVSQLIPWDAAGFVCWCLTRVPGRGFTENRAGRGRSGTAAGRV